MTIATLGGAANASVIRGLPFLTWFNGDADTIFYVHHSGADSGKGSRTRPFATIDYAIGRCSNGDTIMVLPGHAETVTTAITVDMGRVSIIGQGGPTQMPTITVGAVIDAMTITAANCTIANLRFAAPTVDAATAHINVAAAGTTISNTYHIGSTTSNNMVDIITLTAAANDLLIDGVHIYNTVVECVGGIVFEGASARAEVRNCVVYDAIGFTDGCISDEAAATGLYVHHNVWKNAKAATAVVNFANATGIAAYNMVAGRHTTIASNAVYTAMDVFENYITEQGQLNGLFLPAIDT